MRKASAIDDNASVSDTSAAPPMADSRFVRTLLSNLAARSRRRLIRKLLQRVDIQEMTWLPPGDSPLSYRDSPVRLAMDYVIGPRTLAFGHWHDEHCQWLRQHMQKGIPYHLVDVGANAGLVSRQLLASPGLRFEGADCFEPDPESFDLLQANLAPFERVRLHPEALSDIDGEAEMFRSSRNAGNISLMPDTELRARKDLRAQTVKLRAAGPAGARILESLVSPDTRLVWKSDTQGHDLKIIAAMPASFWQRVDVALVEVTSVATEAAELDRFLDIVAGFPVRRFIKHGAREVGLQELRAFVESGSGSERDLLLAR